MILTLQRFGQDVDISDPNQVNYFIVFSREDGEELRLPVEEKTTEALVKWLYSSKPKVAAPVEPPVVQAGDLDDLSDEEGATEFGGEGEDDYQEPPPPMRQPNGVRLLSEDTIPSL